MYAFEIPNLRYSLPAASAVARNRFVSIGVGTVGKQATAASQVVGVSMNAVETDKGVLATSQVLDVATGLVMVEAGGANVAGAVVYSDANGKAVSAGTIAVGVAVTDSGADGEFITVLIK